MPPTRVIEREEGVPTTRVLIIYTGGTLGMTHREGSLSPEPEQGNLAALIRNMPEFGDTSLPAVDMLEYDPLLDSSNVGPAEWAMLAESVGAHYYDYDGFVVIHGTDTMCGRRTRARAARNSSPHRAVPIHRLCHRRCYTASALSFMLEGLGKPVVLTGSMIPLCEPFNDARRNLIASVIRRRRRTRRVTAAPLDHHVSYPQYSTTGDLRVDRLELCEVSIFFNDRLLRGNRAIKIDADGLAAFDLAQLPRPRHHRREDRHRRPLPVAAAAGCRLRVHTSLDTRIVCVSLTPGFDDGAISAMIAQPRPPRPGARLYGTHGPAARRASCSMLSDAIERGILVVAAECPRGAVSISTYEEGRALLQLGVISAIDMTTRACVTKIAYLYGRGLRGAALRDAMAEDLRGEITFRPQEQPSLLERL